MEIHYDDRRSSAQVGDQRVGATERIVHRRHKGPPHQVEHPDGNAVDGKGTGTPARRGRRIVCRSDDTVAALEVLAKITLVENVIAAGDEINAALEHLL